MSYNSFISAVHIVDNLFGPALAPVSDAAADNNGSSVAGSLDDWKVTWRKEGAEFGQLTLGLGCGCIMAFSSLPMSALMGGLGAVGQLAQIAIPVALPDYLGKPLYALGAWAGKHIGYQVGWYGGALAAETFELLEKIFNKLSQIVNTLLSEIMTRFGYSSASDHVEPEFPPTPPPSPVLPPPPSPPSPPSSPLTVDNVDVPAVLVPQPCEGALQSAVQPEGPIVLINRQQEDKHIADDVSVFALPLSLPPPAIAGVSVLPSLQDDVPFFPELPKQLMLEAQEESKDPLTPVRTEGAPDYSIPYMILNNGILIKS